MQLNLSLQDPRHDFSTFYHLMKVIVTGLALRYLKISKQLRFLAQ